MKFKLQICRVICTVLLFAATSVVRAEDEPKVLMTLELKDGRIQIAPEGDDLRAFAVDPAEAEQIDGRWIAGSRFAISDDSLYLDGISLPRERMGHMDVERKNSHVEVIVYDRGETARRLPRKNNETPVGTDLTVEASEFIRGYVLSFGGDIHVNGEVNRSVVCVGGDAYIEDGGVVRGSVVSLGGKVHKNENATVYGDLYSGNRRSFRPRWFEQDEENVIQFDLAFDYNRTTGALPWAKLTVGPTHSVAPSLDAQVGYAFESELWHYRLGAGHDKPRGPLYYAGAYRETLNDDTFRIGEIENTVNALLFRTDYRDYYFAEGFKIEGGWAFGRDRRFRVGYHNELINALPAYIHLWSLFGGDPFRANYAMVSGSDAIPLISDTKTRLAFIRAQGTYHYPYFTEPDIGSWRFGFQAEAAGDGLGSDYTYTRAYAWVTRSQPIWRNQTVRVRVSAGGSGGRIPIVRQFYLGGISTLPGYDYKLFAGDRYWLGNLEYIWNLNGSIGLFAAMDAGQIGSDADWTDSDVLTDAGLGISVEDALRVQISWPLVGESGDPLVTFRLSRPF